MAVEGGSPAICWEFSYSAWEMFALELPDLPTYHHCLARIICNPPLPRCYLGECDACPAVEKFKEELAVLLDENDMDQIIYKQWISTDRSTPSTPLPFDPVYLH